MKTGLQETRHVKFMTEALRLARKGEGCTRPNPPVGAVIVKNGRIIGSGYHKCAGGPHAEIFAIRDAGRAARGGSLYVTLEPCSTRGRTGPCTDAIIKAGIKAVYAAVVDPNAKHAGKGIKILSRAGIKVHVGICEDKALEIISGFGKWIRHKTPHLTLKLALSIDGRIADLTGRSKWITGPRARNIVNELRKKSDAVMVGIETVLKDDPILQPKGRHASAPFRIIVDSSGRIPLTAKVFTDGRPERTIIATTGGCSRKKIDLMHAAGAKVINVPAVGGKVSLKSLMKILGRLGILRVLCEGGGGIAESLIRSGLVDDYYFFIAPVIIGGVDARPAVGGRGWLLKEAPRLKFGRPRRVGADILITARKLQKG